jgi:predicted porin
MKALPLAAALVSLCAASAQAQSSVTVFGIVDANFAHMSGAGNASQTMIGTDGYSSSRIGFRGVEDLGGNLKVGFWLEGAFSPDTGQGGTTNANNQLAGNVAATGLNFGRRSTISLIGSWGEVRVGRDFVPGFQNLSAFSPFGTNGVGTSAFLFYPVQAAARVTHIRASNSIGFFLPKMGDVYGQAMYAFGENPSNAGATSDDGKVAGLRLGYSPGPFDIAFGITKTKISALGDLTQTNLGASYDFGVVKAMALWNENKVGATRTRTYLIGGHIPAGPGVVRAAYSRVGTTGVANDANHLALGYVYNLSKRSALYANYAHISNKNNGTNYNVGVAVLTPGGSSSGYELGIRHSF